jgi:Uncharacterized protein conserved in bacteria (DUF2188)
MSKKSNVHVVPREKAWAVVREGSPRASAVTATQKESIAVARKIAKEGRGELSIHGADGKIRSKDSYGNDPSPPKG